MEFVSEDDDVLVKTAKPNFKTLGPKYGKLMKFIPKAVSQISKDEFKKLEDGHNIELEINNEKIIIEPIDIEISTKDIQGWKVSTYDNLTVAIDVNINDELRNEGYARDLVNRIQTIRKNRAYDVIDKISLKIKQNDIIKNIVNENFDYICNETLADNLSLVSLDDCNFETVELSDNLKIEIEIKNISNNIN